MLWLALISAGDGVAQVSCGRSRELRRRRDRGDDLRPRQGGNQGGFAEHVGEFNGPAMCIDTAGGMVPVLLGDPADATFTSLVMPMIWPAGIEEIPTCPPRRLKPSCVAIGTGLEYDRATSTTVIAVRSIP
jgi:hypothetical protein